MNREELVKEFHNAMKLQSDIEMSSQALRFRLDLIIEEYNEFVAEVTKANRDIQTQGSVSHDTKVALAKELADLQYVISGFAVTFGLPLEAVLDRVHASNMTKVDPETGHVFVRADGKILKGPNYKPAELEDLIV